jgi:WD40 repeat protein
MLRSSMHVHTNGILDLAFSEDGSRLVTGSADRTCTVIDVETETIAVQLSNEHVGTIRQVAFQPGQSNGNVIASGGLDGRIVIWDLRCGSVPAQTFTTRDGKDGRIRTQRNTSMPVVNGSAINRIYKAHSRVYDGKESKASLTSIHWLPEGRQHLLLSSSDVNTSVKLWDTRWMKPSNNPEYKPVSKTTPPSHHTFRPYGLMSITMNADASRFYALCYDNTVYAYSTAHLVLGQAPELSDRCVKRRPRDGDGLGPLYGFKNEHLDVRSFYLRARVRPASNYGPELLAVGSRSAWPILFPTDERYLRTAWSKRNHILRQDPLLSGTPSSARPTTTPQSLSPSNCDIPIYQCGTPLAHGHSREVTNVAWTHNGRLVTASDDGYIRHWQEDAAEARHLRQVGDFGGERWMAGWALVDDDWDGEDDCGDDNDDDDEQ